MFWCSFLWFSLIEILTSFNTCLTQSSQHSQAEERELGHCRLLNGQIVNITYKTSPLPPHPVSPCLHLQMFVFLVETVQQVGQLISMLVVYIRQLMAEVTH